NRVLRPEGGNEGCFRECLVPALGRGGLRGGNGNGDEQQGGDGQAGHGAPRTTAQLRIRHTPGRPPCDTATGRGCTPRRRTGTIRPFIVQPRRGAERVCTAW